MNDPLDGRSNRFIQANLYLADKHLAAAKIMAGDAELLRSAASMLEAAARMLALAVLRQQTGERRDADSQVDLRNLIRQISAECPLAVALKGVDWVADYREFLQPPAAAPRTVDQGSLYEAIRALEDSRKQFEIDLSPSEVEDEQGFAP